MRRRLALEAGPEPVRPAHDRTDRGARDPERSTRRTRCMCERVLARSRRGLPPAAAAPEARGPLELR